MKKLLLSMAIMAMMSSCGSSQADKATGATGDSVVAAEETVKSDTLSKVAEATEATEATEAGAVKELKDSAQLVVADKPIIIDFNATWCGPCKQFAPHFHAVAEKYADKALFYSVDTDKWPNVATAFKVEGIPMVAIVTKDGKTVTRTGYMEEADFEKFVKENI
ncbi:MAG: thioredoxin fold domain-containing protein [Muribaculaceae bacterium]|nr:thioredoxin fold domain-containing protein [Muribaculaceae bacterium]